MIKKPFIFFSLLITSVHALASTSVVVGEWECKMTNGDMEFQMDISLRTNGSYETTTSVFTSTMIDQGKWNIENSTLILNRVKHIKNGKKELSEQEFRRDIIEANNSKLMLKAGKTVYDCTK